MWNFDINHIQVDVESRPAYKLALDWSQWLDSSMIPPESPYSVMIDSCIGLLLKIYTIHSNLGRVSIYWYVFKLEDCFRLASIYLFV